MGILCGFSTFGQAAPYIRVALATDATQLHLTAGAFFCRLPPVASASVVEVDRDLPALHKARITATPAGVLVDTTFFPGDRLQCEATAGALHVNGAVTTGALEIVRDHNARLAAISTLPIETYVAGVMAKEIQASWPAETLKAQAIASRSYVLSKLGGATLRSAYDVVTTVEDQVYDGAAFVAPAIAEAVRVTEGQVLSQNQQIVRAYFHSTCGGQTEHASAVWGEHGAWAPEIVRDPFCKKSPHRSWHSVLTQEELQTRLAAAGYVTPDIRQIELTPETDGVRVAQVTLVTTGEPLQLPTNMFRKIVGYDQVKSAWFDARHTRTGWSFAGHGFGHGVGMCQWGAKGMADAGHSYRDILQFYFPGTEVVKTY